VGVDNGNLVNGTGLCTVNSKYYYQGHLAQIADGRMSTGKYYDRGNETPLDSNGSGLYNNIFYLNGEVTQLTTSGTGSHKGVVYVNGVPNGGRLLYFFSQEDGDWNNPNNWWINADFSTLANTTPTRIDAVVVASNITHGPNSATSIIELTVNEDVQLNAGLSIVGKTTFKPRSENKGTLTLNEGSFENNSQNSGYITGNPVFKSTYELYNPWGGVIGTTSDYGSFNTGTIHGNPEFYGASFNSGTIVGNPTFKNFMGYGIQPDWLGSNRGAGLIQGNPSFQYASTNTATIIGNPSFTHLTFNAGIITGNAFFDWNSSNASQGVIHGDATFEGNATNQGTVTGHIYHL
jgi:hypothetical protein